MAIIKCKMCGGDVELAADKTFGTCEYCGSTMTFPKVDDEQRAAAFNRGNHFRRIGEFDKALAVYERIVREDDTDAEAHWCCALCRFGIEYVEDPTTYEYLPTCHRASFDSFLEDVDYLAAVEHSDGITKRQYQKDGAKIAEVQRGILATSQNEEPFDVFICYKESDENGERTRDSLMAQDIYYQLTDQGHRVFFARITLEDMAGKQYEPYIFAALNSARVMIVVGTKAEYMNAVWVKNEWSRFLAMMKKDHSKLLLPCYRDMDPYDMPEQLAVLQSYDMSKIGFIQDLLRGIKKVTAADEPKTTVVQETVVSAGNTNTAPLLKRAFMFLEDGDWNSANEYCEKVLDIDPENAQAYLGKLMAELRAGKQEDLKDQPYPFADHNNYQKTIRFADEKLKAELAGYIEHINIRNENARIDGTYTRARNTMIAAKTEAAYKEAAHLFESISGWKDADEQIVICQQKIDKIKAKEEAERLDRERQAALAREEAERIHIRNLKITAVVLAVACVFVIFIIILNTVIIPNSKYNDAIALMEVGNLDEAYNIFLELGDYKDAAAKVANISLLWLKNAQVGDYVFFGTYEQDNNISNGKEAIEWLVLEVKDGKALVISKYALDCKMYNTSKTGVTWETCSLRRWLNIDFMNTAFSADEKAMIPTVTVSADKNPVYGTDPGNATQDQVFLLSIAEAKEYFSSDSARQCEPTDYAVAKGAYVNKDNGNCRWWLRSLGRNGDYAAGVYSDIYGYGCFVNYDKCAVRPALWINLSSLS